MITTCKKVGRYGISCAEVEVGMIQEGRESGRTEGKGNSHINECGPYRNGIMDELGGKTRDRLLRVVGRVMQKRLHDTTDGR